VAGFWFLWLMVSVFWRSFPINIFNRGGSATLVYLLSLLAVLSTGIYAQIYRYHQPEEPEACHIEHPALLDFSIGEKIAGQW
jgi:hypothetical protein